MALYSANVYASQSVILKVCVEAENEDEAADKAYHGDYVDVLDREVNDEEVDEVLEIERID